VIALALLLLLAGCGDTSPYSQALAYFSESARPMNSHEAGVCQGTAHCMDLDDQFLPAIEYCEDCFAGLPPDALGKYDSGTDRISIRPAWRGVDGLLAHECLHAHLSRRTGDLDARHASPYFRACAPPEYIGGNHQ